MKIWNHLKYKNKFGNVLKLNNQGSSIVMVLVAMAFVAILGTVILSTTVTNVQMKVMDKKEKANFYTTENILDLIKESLQREAGEALGTAYMEVMQNFSSFSNKTEREDRFKEIYMKELKSSLNLPLTDATGNYDIDLLKNYLTETDHKAAIYSDYPYWQSGVEGVTLQNIEVNYENNENILSKIKTDLHIGIPEVEFTENATLPQIMDYVLIAENGLDFNNTYAFNHEIKGNVFSGKNITIEGSSTTVNFKQGQHLVAKEDIVIKDHATMIGATMSTWAKNIEVDTGNLSLKGDTKVANDLKLNGKGSNVILENSYSGYGDSTVGTNRELPAEVKNHFMDSKNKTSSAININGMNTSLNMEKLSKFLVSGHSYILTENITNDSSNLEMGESVTMISNQIAYLIPGALIGDGGLTNGGKNPLTDSEELAISSDRNVVNMSKTHERFGNKSLNELGASVKKIYRTDFNLVEPMVYYYLAFSDTKKANEFFNIYYAVDGNKDLFQFYSTLYNNVVKIKDSTNIDFTINGNMMYYNGSEIKKVENTTVSQSRIEKLKKEQTNYYKEFFALCKSLTVDFNGLSTQEMISAGLFENLVDINNYNALFTGSSNEVLFMGTDGTYGMAVKDSKVEIKEGNHTNLKFLITNGDVEISNNFEGIIIAKGNIKIKGGAQYISSNPVKASKLLSAQNNNSVKLSSILKGNFGFGSGSSGGTDKEKIELSELVSYKNWHKQ